MTRLDAPSAIVDTCMLPGAGVTLEFLAAIVDHIAHPIFVKDPVFVTSCTRGTKTRVAPQLSHAT